MRKEKEIREQMNRALEELRKIEKSQGKLGAGGWTRMRGYADALEWVLKEE